MTYKQKLMSVLVKKQEPTVAVNRDLGGNVLSVVFWSAKHGARCIPFKFPNAAHARLQERMAELNLSFKQLDDYTGPESNLLVAKLINFYV